MYVGRLKAILLGVAFALMAQPPLTTIQDTLYRADGTRFNGTITVSWRTFDASNTADVAMQSKTADIVNGALYLQLAPNTNATPVNNYSVLYVSDGKEQFRETWAVPPSATPLRVRDVRVNGLTSGGTGGGGTGGITGGGTGNTPIPESQVIGLANDLQIRPVSGPGFAPGRAAVINGTGQVEGVAGNPGDCVHVDGTTGPCFDASLLATFVDKEVPAGVVDGSNDTFSVVNTPTPASSLTLYRNGVYQTPASDFTLSVNGIQFAAASVPQPGDRLTVSYRVGGNGGTPTRQITTVAPLTGGGSLSTDLTLTLTDSAFLRRGHRTNVIGDSQAGGFTPAGSFPVSLPNWFNQAAVESRSTIQWAGNAGVLANGTSAMLDRLPNVIAKHPDKVFIIAGYSDLNYVIPISTIAANINQMVNLFKAANIMPIICTLPPQPLDPGQLDANAAAQIVPLNLQIRRIAKQQGIPLVDFYSILVDPLTGLYRVGFSPDNSHPQMPATRLMAERAISATANLFDQEYPFLPQTDTDVVNMILDPLFLENPSRWTAATVSGVAMQTAIGTDPAISGNTITLTKTNTASVNTLTGATVSGGINPGDTVAFVGRIKSSNCEAGAMQFDVGLQFDPGAQTSYPIYHWPVDIKDGQWYIEIVVPAGATSITPVITLNGGTGSVTLGQIGVINLTQLGF